MALDLAAGDPGMSPFEQADELDDDFDDDDADETIGERVAALAEMFPAPLRRTVGALVGGARWSLTSGWRLTRSALWVLSTSAVIAVLPVMIEKERADFEQQQMAQQKRMLLGPSAALAGARPAATV